jgi:hypothetical protein
VARPDYSSSWRKRIASVSIRLRVSEDTCATRFQITFAAISVVKLGVGRWSEGAHVSEEDSADCTYSVQSFQVPAIALACSREHSPDMPSSSPDPGFEYYFKACRKGDATAKAVMVGESAVRVLAEPPACDLTSKGMAIQ